MPSLVVALHGVVILVSFELSMKFCSGTSSASVCTSD